MHLGSVEDTNTFGLWVTIEVKSFGTTVTAPFGRDVSSSNSLNSVNTNTNPAPMTTNHKLKNMLNYSLCLIFTPLWHELINEVFAVCRVPAVQLKLSCQWSVWLAAQWHKSVDGTCLHCAVADWNTVQWCIVFAYSVNVSVRIEARSTVSSYG